jgi:NTE family protein
MNFAPGFKRRTSAQAGRLIVAVAYGLLVTGCSTARPWINAPLEPGEVVRYDGLRQIADPARSPDLLVIASFSGGGSRAAALAHAVLVELDRVPLQVNGRSTTLAREIDVVTGVSGGSIAAAYLALHGTPRFLNRFGSEFLDVDFGSELVGATLGPAGLHRLSSAYVGRGNLLADSLDAQMFGGATFGSLAELSERPYLIVGATDVASGAEFDFASDSFGRLCSSIDTVPLAFAVAASSAVPLVFTPLTLANHGPRCPRPAAPVDADDDVASRTRLVMDDMDQYSDPARRYVHLVDGGVSDNLGVRRIIDYVAQSGGIDNVLQMLQSPDGRLVQHIVFINIGSERRSRSALDGEQRTPGTLEVVAALASGGVGRASRATELAFAEATRGWKDDLRRLPAPYSNVDVYAIQVDLASTIDESLRERARAIPTTFHVRTEDRAILQSVAAAGVERSTEFARLRAALDEPAQHDPADR